MQAALAIVQPGDTIQTSGTLAPFTVSAAGTAAAPITIRTADPAPFQTMTVVQATGSSPAITVSGASYVNLSGFFAVGGTGSTLLITGSNHIVFDSSSVRSTSAAQPALHVTGGSSYVTISRDEGISTGSGGLVVVDGGGTGDQITTNNLGRSIGAAAIAVDGVSNVAVTSNSTRNSCGAGIQVTGGSTATIENNVVGLIQSASLVKSCAVQPSDARGLVVDASSATGSTANYNVIDVTTAGAGALDYSWAGTSYAAAASLTTATGQGAHDINSLAVPNTAALGGTSLSAIDSANTDAPGELPTDLLGHARVDDPIVPNSGVGTQTYYDRGALETQPTASIVSLWLSGPAGNLTTAPVGGSVTLTGSVQDPWDAAVTCDFDFGDGTSAKVAATGNAGGMCGTNHQYATTGAQSPRLSVTFSDGSTKQAEGQIVIDSPAPVVPSLAPVAGRSTAVFPGCNATSGWTIDIYTVDFGDGAISNVSSCAGFDHSYSKPGTYVIKLTAYDAGGNSATTSVPFTTAGGYYTPLAPSRILDTRQGTGTGSAAKVPANGVVKLKVAGAGGVPASGATAVVLNVTVTGANAGGYVTAYPDGGARPGTSNLNFSAGQTIPNTVIVKVGGDGYVDLANVSAGATHLVADVEGYYSIDSTSGYNNTPVPIRVLDTRTNKSTIPPGGTTRVYFRSYGNNVSAAALNVTVANAQAGGYINAYPEGQPMPTASNVNFSARRITQNEVIVKVGADGYVDFTNKSAGSTDLIVDMSGYFTAGSGMAFVPIAPTRVMDTRLSQYAAGPVGANEAQAVSMENNPAIAPGTPQAVAANITLTQPAANGYITAYPDDAGVRPLASVLNFTAGQTLPNAATIRVGTSFEGVMLYNGSGGSVHLIADVFGLYN